MSHFMVAVFTKPGGPSVEELLQPYHEFECTGTNDQYVQSIDQLAEARKEYSEHKVTRYRKPDGTLVKRDDSFYRDPTPEELEAHNGKLDGTLGCGNGISWVTQDWHDGKGIRAKVYQIPEGYTEAEVLAPEVMEFYEFVEYYYGRKFIGELDTPDLEGEHKFGWCRLNDDNEVIELIDRTNPNKKWDWWQCGGRYSGRLRLKSGAGSGTFGTKSWVNMGTSIAEGTCDSALVKDVDWSLNKKQYDKAIRFWEVVVDEQPLISGEDKGHFWSLYKPDYYRKMFGTKEAYAESEASFGTYAVVTPDGKWHEKGQMGWFGCSSETPEEAQKWSKSYKEAFIDAADPECTVTIVDCHI